MVENQCFSAEGVNVRLVATATSGGISVDDKAEKSIYNGQPKK
jgi:hypothetical protein